MTPLAVALAWVASGLAATPVPSPSRGPDPDSVTPGLTGFLATFALVAVCLLLFVSLVRRLRRMQYRSEHEDQYGNPVDRGRVADGGTDDGPVVGHDVDAEPEVDTRKPEVDHTKMDGGAAGDRGDGEPRRPDRGHGRS